MHNDPSNFTQDAKFKMERKTTIYFHQDFVEWLSLKLIAGSFNHKGR